MTTAIARYAQQGLEIAAANFDTSILAGTKSPNTIEQYRMHFAAYCTFAVTFGAAMQPATLARWRQHLYETGYTTAGTIAPYSVAAINQRLAAIRGVVTEAAQQGYITHELAEQFKHVKGLKQVANKDRRKAHSRTPISKIDMNRIVDAPDTTTPAGKMHRALLLTLATCGMRISEAVNLCVTDIQFQTNGDKAGWVVYVLGKNMVDPEARPLGKTAQQAISEWLAVRAELGVLSEFVFTGFGGRGSRCPAATHITRGSAWEIVQRYAKALDLAHIKPHDFRRYVGTQLAKKDIRLAQRQLGHKRIETTAQHYVLDDVALGVTDNLL
jgi:integrase/recombinase XerD